MLKKIGDSDFVNNIAKEHSFLDGHFFSEEDVGTGGVGLCLVEKKPVVVYGSEHYSAYYHHLVCYGAPIKDLDGAVIGSISITGSIEFHQPNIMAMLKAAVIILDTSDYILYHNQYTTHLLKVDDESLVNKNIFELIEKESTEKTLNHFHCVIDNHECTLINKYNAPLYLSISIKQLIQENTLSYRILVIESQLEKHRFAALTTGFKATFTFASLKGISPAIETIKRIGYAIAKTDNLILLVGETGTEKDLIAQAIHNASQRKDSPFVTLSCDVSSNQIILTELFGNDKQLGKIELANEGTLLLHDIEQMPLESQEKLYDFLKSKEYYKPNNQYPQLINIRVIVSTSRNLLECIENTSFNRKLYYLLNTMTMVIPPLQERNEDIASLIRNVVKQISPKQNIIFDQDCMKALCSYKWPGNLKQLETVIESAVLASENDNVQLSHLPIEIVNDYYYRNQNKKSLKDFKRANKTVDDESEEIQNYHELLFAIKETQGNAKEAAKLLYMPSSTLYRKLGKYHINPKKYKNNNRSDL